MYRIHTIILVLFSVCLFGNNPKIDSLRVSLNASSTPIERLNLNRKIAIEYMMGQIYLDSALFYYEKASEIAQGNNLNQEQAQTYFQIARTYGMGEEWETSIHYFEKSIEISEQSGNYLGISGAMNNIGKIYLDTDNLKEAKSQFLKVIDICIEKDFARNLGHAYTNLADVYLKLDNAKEALLYLNKAMVIFQKEKLEFPGTLTTLTKSHYRLGNYSEAEKYGQLGLIVAKKQADLDYQYQLSYLLSKLAEKNGQYSKSVELIKNSINIKDSILSARQENELKKMELTIRLNKENSRLSALKKKNQYLYIIYILGTFGVILIFIIFLRHQKLRKMKKEIIEIQKELLASVTN